MGRKGKINDDCKHEAGKIMKSPTEIEGKSWLEDKDNDSHFKYDEWKVTASNLKHCQLFINCVTLGTLSNLSKLSFLICKIGIITVYNSLGYWEDWTKSWQCWALKKWQVLVPSSLSSLLFDKQPSNHFLFFGFFFGHVNLWLSDTPLIRFFFSSSTTEVI